MIEMGGIVVVNKRIIFLFVMNLLRIISGFKLRLDFFGYFYLDLVFLYFFYLSIFLKNLKKDLD